jgi:hypothetical protein
MLTALESRSVWLKSRSSSWEMFPGLAVRASSQRALFFRPATPSSGAYTSTRICFVVRHSRRKALVSAIEMVTDGRPRGEVEDEDEEDPEPRYLMTLVVLKT